MSVCIVRIIGGYGHGTQNCGCAAPLHGHGNPLQHAGGGATEALQSSPKDSTPTYIILSNRAVSIAISIFYIYIMNAMYITLREIYNYTVLLRYYMGTTYIMLYIISDPCHAQTQ